MKLNRSVSAELVALCASAYFISALNVPFWQQLYKAVAPGSLYEFAFVGAVALLAFALLAWAFVCLAIPYVFKPVLSILLLTTSAAAYYTAEYGTVFDADMVRNILETDRAEATELITANLLILVLGLGAVPAAILWALDIVYRPVLRGLRFKALTTLATATAVLAIGLPFAANFTSVFRHHRELQFALMPINYLSAMAEVGRRSVRPARAALLPFGTDARRHADATTAATRSVTVLVIGETARAANFSLNGYGRETNPLLAKVPDLITYSKVFSCGTATAQSLPCLFSGMGRTKYDRQDALAREGMLQILQRAGFSVLWRENQGGCAGVCRGIPIELMDRAGTRALFEIGDSLDENLINGLQEKIDAMPGHAVIVLHMMGSHGPAYHKRYPAAFERFQPACKETQFSRCPRQEIVNAYDNTIVYTDFVLARLIELLRKTDRAGTPASMIYISDHGESLGEGNVYLHGLPYALAPDMQKHVPMLVWLSPIARFQGRIDGGCLARSRHEPLSHDNFFHSVLGLLHVNSEVYDRKLDLFAPCRVAGGRDED